MTDRAGHHAGEAIRAARVAVGLSLRALAQSIDVSPATVSAIENGKTGLSVARLQDVAAVLGVRPTRLLSSDDSAPAFKHVSYQPGSTRGASLPNWRQFPPLAIDPVLSVAIDCFVETGYHGTSMRTLAARIGLSVPAIYHHYADKQQLLVRILDVTMSDLHWRVAA